MSTPPDYPPYQPHRNSQSFDPNTPPAPPPKPGSQEVSRRSTPATGGPLPPPPPQENAGNYSTSPGDTQQAAHLRDLAYAQHTQDPGENWLPKILENKKSVLSPSLNSHYNTNPPLQQTRSSPSTHVPKPPCSTHPLDNHNPPLHPRLPRTPPRSTNLQHLPRHPPHQSRNPPNPPPLLDPSATPQRARSGAAMAPETIRYGQIARAVRAVEPVSETGPGRAGAGTGLWRAGGEFSGGRWGRRFGEGGCGVGSTV